MHNHGRDLLTAVYLCSLFGRQINILKTHYSSISLSPTFMENTIGKRERESNALKYRITFLYYIYVSAVRTTCIALTPLGSYI